MQTLTHPLILAALYLILTPIVVYLLRYFISKTQHLISLKDHTRSDLSNQAIKALFQKTKSWFIWGLSIFCLHQSFTIIGATPSELLAKIFTILIVLQSAIWGSLALELYLNHLFQQDLDPEVQSTLFEVRTFETLRV